MIDQQLAFLLLVCCASSDDPADSTRDLHTQLRKLLTKAFSITVLAYVVHRVSKADDESTSDKFLAQDFGDAQLNYFSELIIQDRATAPAVE